MKDLVFLCFNINIGPNVCTHLHFGSVWSNIASDFKCSYMYFIMFLSSYGHKLISYVHRYYTLSFYISQFIQSSDPNNFSTKNSITSLLNSIHSCKMFEGARQYLYTPAIKCHYSNLNYYRTNWFKIIGSSVLEVKTIFVTLNDWQNNFKDNCSCSETTKLCSIRHLTNFNFWLHRWLMST